MLVADIAKNVFKYRNDCFVSGRQKNSAHRHQTKQACRFQGNGFSARVWSRNHYHVEISAKTEVDRHNGFFVYERVPPSFYVENPPVVELGASCVQLDAIPRFRKNTVQICDNFGVCDQKLGKGADFIGKLGQNSFNLLPFFQKQLSELIIEIYNCDRLDIQCRAC